MSGLSTLDSRCIASDEISQQNATIKSHFTTANCFVWIQFTFQTHKIPFLIWLGTYTHATPNMRHTHQRTQTKHNKIINKQREQQRQKRRILAYVSVYVRVDTCKQKWARFLVFVRVYVLTKRRTHTENAFDGKSRHKGVFDPKQRREQRPRRTVLAAQQCLYRLEWVFLLLLLPFFSFRSPVVFLLHSLYVARSAYYSDRMHAQPFTTHSTHWRVYTQIVRQQVTELFP